MAKALKVITGERFKSSQDTDKVKTVWLIRGLTSLEMLRATSKGYVDHDMILMLGITGWEKFKDGKGKDIPYDVNNIERIPPDILQDISFKIQELSNMTEDERKN